MKNITLTALGLLLSITSFSQQRPATFNGGDYFLYEVVKETVPIGEGKINYNTNYCFTNDVSTLIFEFRVIHHSWLKEVSFFYMMRNKEGSSSICDPSVGMKLMSLDIIGISSPAIRENGNMYLRKGGLTCQVKWNSKDHTFIDLVEYTYGLGDGTSAHYTFK